MFGLSSKRCVCTVRFATYLTVVADIELITETEPILSVRWASSNACKAHVCPCSLYAFVKGKKGNGGLISSVLIEI